MAISKNEGVFVFRVRSLDYKTARVSLSLQERGRLITKKES